MLRLLEPTHTVELLTLIQSNRDHLDRWLRWSAHIQTHEDAAALITRFATKYAANDGFLAGILVNETLVGGLICHKINVESAKCEIGYWLGAAHTGKGYVTRACHAVIALMFGDLNLHRIEIQCATDNTASRAVAERLGFTLEGVLRESEWITSSFRDHAMYSLLAQEWKQNPENEG